MRSRHVNVTGGGRRRRDIQACTTAGRAREYRGRSARREMTVRARDVANANERFYDRIAGVYDHVDSRRSGHPDHAWVDRILAEIRTSRGGRFLDAGSGSGFLARRAVGRYERVSVIDISKEMLAR